MFPDTERKQSLMNQGEGPETEASLTPQEEPALPMPVPETSHFCCLAS